MLAMVERASSRSIPPQPAACRLNRLNKFCCEIDQISVVGAVAGTVRPCSAQYTSQQPTISFFEMKWLTWANTDCDLLLQGWCAI